MASAIAVTMDFIGGTLDQYDKAIQMLEIQPDGGKGGPGCLFHVCEQTQVGIRLTECWESMEAFNAWSQQVIAPVSMAVGAQMPQVFMREVHAFTTSNEGMTMEEWMGNQPEVQRRLSEARMTMEQQRMAANSPSDASAPAMS